MFNRKSEELAANRPAFIESDISELRRLAPYASVNLARPVVRARLPFQCVDDGRR